MENHTLTPKSKRIIPNASQNIQLVFTSSCYLQLGKAKPGCTLFGARHCIVRALDNCQMSHRTLWNPILFKVEKNTNVGIQALLWAIYCTFQNQVKTQFLYFWNIYSPKPPLFLHCWTIASFNSKRFFFGTIESASRYFWRPTNLAKITDPSNNYYQNNVDRKVSKAPSCTLPFFTGKS